MLVSEFGFVLPPELIAQQPPAVRGTSRMLRLDRRTGAVEDRRFAELPDLLQPGDLVVLNDSRVLPARLFATRAGLRTQAGSPAPGGVVEVLLTERLQVPGELVWRALVKPAKKVGIGETLLFAPEPGGEALLRAEVTAAGAFGERTLRFSTPANRFAGDPGFSTPANRFAGDPGFSTPANRFAGDPGFSTPTNRFARDPGFSTPANRFAGEPGGEEPGFAPLTDFHAVLERIGFLPLPPYIQRDRAMPNSAEDRERYQTVYSRPFGAAGGLGVGMGGGETQTPFGNDNKKGEGEQQIPCGDDSQKRDASGKGNGNDGSGEAVEGSAAAPTAGLHFTPEVLERLRLRGVEVARVTLHVGLGTFQPVRVERTEEIRLHAEPYTLSAETAGALNRAWTEGRRVIAVGTTTTRTLEHLARRFEAEWGALSRANPLRLEPHSGSTELFLSPAPDGDDRFKLVGGMLTNFHLPQSTLLMLVSAFAGRERVLAAYAHAVADRYRFFSYGDCMLVV